MRGQRREFHQNIDTVPLGEKGLSGTEGTPAAGKNMKKRKRKGRADTNGRSKATKNWELHEKVSRECPNY